MAIEFHSRVEFLEQYRENLYESTGLIVTREEAWSLVKVCFLTIFDMVRVKPVLIYGVGKFYVGHSRSLDKQLRVRFSFSPIVQRCLNSGESFYKRIFYEEEGVERANYELDQLS